MLVNRSMPPSTVTPVLAYADVAQAVDWLCAVFGFAERLRIGTHRAQLRVADGAVVVVASSQPRQGEDRHSVMVQVTNVDSHYEHTRQHGAHILQPPTDYPFGERQYTVEDLDGHRWTFSQSIADVDPATWGGTVIDIR